MKRSWIKRGTSQMKRTGFRKATYTTLNGHKIALRRTKLRVLGHSSVSEQKREIQALVRQIVIKRDKGCILLKLRHCGGEIGEAVLQGDHLITRGNSATYADTRLIVCVCKVCHGWKHWHEAEYNDLVRTILPPDRIELWDKCEEDRKRHITYKADWKIHIILLKKELQTYE